MYGGEEYSVFEAIIAVIATIVALIAIVISFSPVIDYLAFLLGGLPANPYVEPVMPIFKWYHLIIAGWAICSIIWLWKIVMRRIRYTRPDQRDLW